MTSGLRTHTIQITSNSIRGMILLPSLLLPLALLAAPTAPDSGVVTQPVELDGAWKFRTGDDIAWAGDLKADAGWKDISVPGELETVAPDYDGFAWYRRSVDLPPALRGEPVGIAFGVVGDACRGVLERSEDRRARHLPA